MWELLTTGHRAVQQWLLFGPVWQVALASAALGAVVGRFLAEWIQSLIGESSLAPASRGPRGWKIGTAAATGLLFAVYVLLVTRGRVLQTPDGGHMDWVQIRILHHFVFLSLLVAATGTDLLDYIIPDAITLYGLVYAVVAAAVVGNLQIVPVWVDWNEEIPSVRGPWIPQWIQEHWWLHGIAWSTAGAAAGAGMTWVVRQTAGFLLGRDAMGFGDVTLMAMIGAFLGWQPVICTAVLAPIVGLLVGVAVRLTSGKAILAFGPYLCAAAAVVLGSWKWIWTAIRTLFGDPLWLGGVLGGTYALLLLLLLLCRLYRMIPVSPGR